jgi:nucleotide-binding universal stress UspA family protein
MTLRPKVPTAAPERGLMVDPMSEEPAPRSIVVGVDGSKAAIYAALWAVDEALCRDIPLRLLCAVDPGDTTQSHKHAAQKLAVAETAAREAVMAIEATDKPVKIEVEIDQDRPVSALIRASRPAAMICVGAVGFHHFQPGRVGSTAAAVATSAHCPVAVIHTREGGHARRDPGWIVVEADNSPRTGVLLEAAVDEARLRNAPLRIITCWQSRVSDIHGSQSVADTNRRVQAELDRQLSRWTHQYPDLDVQSVAVHGNLIDYLAENADSVQLVVIGARDHHIVQQLVGPSGFAALRHTNCSVLVVDHQHL